ncbi:MAG TPA: hypothetical protein VGM92_04430 [Candidatus Kapabacteria bacterium]
MKTRVQFLFVFAAMLTLVTTSVKAQPKVLAELFCNFNCPNCPVPDSTYEAYAGSHPGVVLINYHNSIADNKDIFYTNSNTNGAADARSNLYAVASDPSASIGGTAIPSSDGELVWETPYTSSELKLSLPLSISSSISSGPSGTGIDTIFFTISGSVSKQVAYYVAIKESNIYYQNHDAGYVNPSNIWNDVFRSMLPDNANGNGVQFSASGTQKFSVIYDPDNYVYTGNEQNMTAVIFVQDVKADAKNSYQVEGLDTISLAPSSAVVESSSSASTHLMISSNPLSSRGHLGFELVNPSNVRLDICDLLGRTVRTLVDGMAPAGQSSVDMTGIVIPAGCYIARLIVNGAEADMQKFIIAP